MPEVPAVAAAVYVARSAGHALGDQWVQTDRQAQNKGRAGRVGILACAAHVLTYTIVNVVLVALANRVLKLGLSRRAIVLGEVVSAGSHFVADRREHGVMYRLAVMLGKSRYLATSEGAGALDQAWHTGFNAAAAVTTAVVADRDRGRRHEVGGPAATVCAAARAGRFDQALSAVEAGPEDDEPAESGEGGSAGSVPSGPGEEVGDQCECDAGDDDLQHDHEDAVVGGVDDECADRDEDECGDGEWCLRSGSRE